MRDWNKIIGKRVVSDQRLILHHRSPESNDIWVLPPGKPSPIINGYIPRGFFAVDDPDGGQDWYIKDDKEKLKVVPADTPDKSNIFERAASTWSGFFASTGSEISKQAGFISSGFQESVKDLKIEAFDLGKNIRQILLIGVALIVIIIISKFV